MKQAELIRLRAAFCKILVLRPRQLLAAGDASFTLLLLAIEFFDELVYIISGAARPSIRLSLGLTYPQIGILFGLPPILNTVLEPVLMLLGDHLPRKRLVITGGLLLGLSLALMAGAGSFFIFLIAEILSRPASSAFVTLSQATLMDENPGREPHWMARWTLAGSLGNLLGPLLLAGAFALALGWRPVYALLAAAGLGMALLAGRFPFNQPHYSTQSLPASNRAVPLRSLLHGLFNSLVQALRLPKLLRWVFLEQTADLLMDVFTDYSALYFADVVGFSSAQTSLIFAGMMAVSLASNLALIPLLERFQGRKLVRLTAAAAALLYPAWLLAPWPAAKLILVFPLRLSTLGWYPVLSAEAYTSAPGRSGAVKAVSSLAGLLGGGLITLIGWVAGRAGLQAAMWLLLLGPLSLLLFVPRSGQTAPTAPIPTSEVTPDRPG